MKLDMTVGRLRELIQGLPSKTKVLEEDADGKCVPVEVGQVWVDSGNLVFTSAAVKTRHRDLLL